MIVFDLQHDTHNMVELISHVSGSNDDANVLEVWGARGDNQDVTKLLSIAGAAGTMTVRGGTRLYKDTLTVTEVDAALEAFESATAANDICKVTFERNAYRYLIVFATTLNSTNVAVELCTYERHNVPS